MMSATVGIVGIGLAILAIGIVQFVAPDFVWKIDKTFNEMHGQKSRRSETWDFGRVLRGVVFTLIGLGAIMIGLFIT